METTYYDTESLVGKSRKQLIQMTGVASMKAAVGINTISYEKKTNSIAREIAITVGQDTNYDPTQGFIGEFSKLPE